MIEWSWFFDTAKVADVDGLTDVIKSVRYELTGTKDEQSRTIGGETNISAPVAKDFVPFANITTEDMVAIIGSSVNVDALKAQITEWLTEVEKPLPARVRTEQATKREMVATAIAVAKEAKAGRR